MSLENLHQLILASESRATIVDNGLAGLKTRFLLKDKIDIMKLLKNEEISLVDACGFLASKGKNYSTWSSRFYAWNKDWENGKLDLGIAVSVQRAKPGKVPINPFDSVVGELLKRYSIVQIEEKFERAIKSARHQAATSALEAVKSTLLSRGITIEDLKAVMGA